ncbi:PHD finger protein 7 [Drosophila yakuba]|uniref:Uncharacterized protein, isoform B n=1 Tax=Drosophila yakuba TaxID=7245 RepID=B4PYX5_DROYA|nr:PHD finger protein 7 [Drosophila yakuba]XP_015046098.1 PHD finger protein 7 [Drosophila yakuba]EDX02053.2 uncharacterized protein Dyak_GE17340, isoform B [Drosophila yakuba]KRK06538.1 uncharacterized protein Dyak_GE17340, isoform C [Drosophila yakuba]
MVQNCVLCRSSERDELIFGTVHVQDNIMVHRNCLYLSSNLVQRGNKRLGILNFLKEDIEEEAKRCRTLMCYYCRRPGANIGCCKSSCRRTFHTKCGIDNLAQNQFSDTYKSYCHQHVLMHRRRPALIKEQECVICAEALIGEGERFSVVTCIFAPCCRNGWFHRKCLQRYANSAGYFFKCPLCNNLEVFRKVAMMGISVLNQDATWETEPNAFADQFRRDVICTAATCVAVSGRDDTSAMLLYCNNCGANPSHFLCTVQNSETYVCHVCAAVLPSPVPYVDSDSDDGDSIDETDFQAAVADLGANEQGDLIHLKLSASLWDDSNSSDDDDDSVFKRAVDNKVVETNSDDKPSTSAAARALSARTRSSLAAAGSSPGSRATAAPTRGTRTTVESPRGSQATTLISRTTRTSVAMPPRATTTTAGSSSRPTLDNQENTEPSTSNVRRSLRPRRTMPARIAVNKESDSEDSDDEPEAKRRRLSPTASESLTNRRLLRSISPEPSTPPRRTLRRRTLANLHPTYTNMDVSCVANRTRNRLPTHLATRKD